MPAKNTEKFIEQAIQSIITQTYTNWELIIVDDKSLDKTKETAESYAKKDNRIKIFDGDGIGIAHTRNQIIHLSQGKYIMLQDSDDVSDPNRMKLLTQEAEKYDKSYISSNIYRTDLNLGIKNISRKPMHNFQIRKGFKRIYNRDMVCPGASLAHRSLYEKNQYHEFIKIMSDWDLVLRLKEDPEVYFHNVQVPLYYYRLNEGSITLCREERIKYNLLVRYNEILRSKNKPEVTSIEHFLNIINSHPFFKISYNFFFLLKKVQHKCRYGHALTRKMDNEKY